MAIKGVGNVRDGRRVIEVIEGAYGSGLVNCSSKVAISGDLLAMGTWERGIDHNPNGHRGDRYSSKRGIAYT